MIRFQFQFNLRAISSLLLIKTLESTDRNHFRVCFWSYLCSHQKVWLPKEGGKQELFRKIIKLDRQQQNPMKPVNFINYLFIFYSTLSYQNSYDSSCGKKAKIYLYNVIHCINGKKVLRGNDKGDSEGNKREMNYKQAYDNCELDFYSFQGGESGACLTTWDSSRIHYVRKKHREQIHKISWCWLLLSVQNQSRKCK